ncbi:hypothetical protein GLYMA_08G074801v4 [Glycine max]|nr:hypothetical protein GLYMA_08G074801v4 [Glycine max]KAH1050109.1 hypothetical protein GYH30_020536 [Glycine max]
MLVAWLLVWLWLGSAHAKNMLKKQTNMYQKMLSI